jgi:uncharacterized protein GlcG (DUF336 family)
MGQLFDETGKGANMSQRCFVRLGATLIFAMSILASAFAQMPNPYGAAVSLENAKKAAAPALAEAVKNNWAMAVAIVDPSGNLVYYEKMDNTQIGSANVAVEKARSAAGGDGMRILRLQGAVPIEGGIPILVDGKIAGAIGVSGGTAAQDGQCAKAGADALK